MLGLDRLSICVSTAEDHNWTSLGQGFPESRCRGRFSGPGCQKGTDLQFQHLELDCLR